ncbi:MAG TPA: hypothetical protein VGZ89_06760 [Xanthobacteraceae bacterium]|jgi:hypothetical protein|nr:hypothetical protein [Xanthobacteraceae bacterium]
MDLFKVALNTVGDQNRVYCAKSAQVACSMHMMRTNSCPQIISDLHKIFTTLDALESQGMTPNQAASQIHSVLADEAVEVPQKNRVPFAWHSFVTCLEAAD